MTRVTPLDLTLARALAKQSFAQWTRAGEAFADPCRMLLGRAVLDVNKGRPPAKVLPKLVEQLHQLIRTSGVTGELVDLGGRRHELSVALPELLNESLTIVLLRGTLNGRTGSIDVRRDHALIATHHVIERLHQRLGTQDSGVVMDEVFSCLAAAVVMRAAAKEAGAHNWPLVSTNGLFVSTADHEDKTPLLITWMRSDQLGKRWGRIADDLRAASSQDSELLRDHEFCVELLRLHDWLLRPHDPGPDFVAQWWAERPAGEQEQAVLQVEQSLTRQEVEDPAAEALAASAASAESSTPDQDSRDHEAGRAQPHSVQVRQRFTGIVLQIRASGAQIVSLGNSVFGVLWPDRRTVDPLGPNASAVVQVGQRIDVEVHRVLGEHYTGPLSIILRTVSAAEDEWAATKQRHPVGCVWQGTMAWRANKGFGIALPGGDVGWLPDLELSWGLDDDASRASLTVGQTLQVIVTGHSNAQRRVLLSARQLQERPPKWSAIQSKYNKGDLVTGTVSWIGTGGILFTLTDGSSGWLDNSEISWHYGDDKARDALAVGQTHKLRVVGYAPQKRNLKLSLRQALDHPLDLVDDSFVGSTHDGIVATVVDFGAFVCLPNGVTALLHRSAIPEDITFTKGETVRVSVESMDQPLRRVALRFVSRNNEAS